MKKRSLILFILRGILLVFLLMFGYFIYKSEYEKTEIVSYEKDNYQLVIYQIGVPDFPFGQGDCRFIISRDERKIDEMDIVLHNDGKQPDEENFDVSWTEEGVSVTVHGEEQEDRTYVLYYEETRVHVLDEPQEFKANFISFDDDSMKVVICDPMDNTVFPDGTGLTVDFREGTYFIDLDGSTIIYDPDRKLFERSIARKLKWVEGMVLQIEFDAYEGYGKDNGYNTHARALKIENVDVIIVDVD